MIAYRPGAYKPARGNPRPENGRRAPDRRRIRSAFRRRYPYTQTLEQIQRLHVLNNKYPPYFFAGAASALIKAWIAFDFAESPEEITGVFFRSLAGYMPIPEPPGRTP